MNRPPRRPNVFAGQPQRAGGALRSRLFPSTFDASVPFSPTAIQAANSSLKRFFLSLGHHTWGRPQQRTATCLRASVDFTDARKGRLQTCVNVRPPGRQGAVSRRQNPSFAWGACLPSTVSHSRPILTSSRDLDYEMAIWDSPTVSYAWKRLAAVQHRQWNDLRDCLTGGPQRSRCPRY